MDWPHNTDYIEAIQTPATSLCDEELRGGQVVCTPLGMPMLWSGNFADVYKLHCPATGNTWAVKCFTREVRGLHERYRQIAAHLEQAALPFTVDFQYLEQGICIKGAWYPVLKMRWVQGLALNEFVKEHLERPGNLKMLLDLWVKLAARLRDARVAHADLQHGNVLLVPMPGGQLALRLIDYDGMHVPALAGTRSGELGHPAYQHPQRLREGIYNAEVDRFSHLAIYTAVRCLMVGRTELWQQFDNGDNLLFREADFRHPENSDIFRTLWKARNADVRTAVGHLILACGRQLDETPLLGALMVNGKMRPLSKWEETAVARIIMPKPRRAPPPSLPSGEGGGVPLRAMVSNAIGGEPASLDAFLESAYSTRPVSQQGTLPAATPSPPSEPPQSGEPPLPSLLAVEPPVGRDAAGTADSGLLGDLRVVAAAVFVPLALVCGLSLIGSALTRPAPSLPPTPPPPHLRLRPVDPQTAEVGKTLMVPVAAEDAAHWKGKLHFSLSSRGESLGATVDPATGTFTWTPREVQGPGEYPVIVSAWSPDGQTARASFMVTVTRPAPPAPPLGLRPIPPQTVELGKPVALTASPEDAGQWAGKLRYSFGAGAPPGASIDPLTGAFRWTPAEPPGPGEYEIAVSARGPGDETAQTTFRVTVVPPLRLRYIPSQTAELGKPLSLTVSAEDASNWGGKLHYSLGAGFPPGANIDPTTGAFTWTPAKPPGPGNYEVAVSARGPGDQTAQTTFAVTVARPLRVQYIPPQTVELGKPLFLTVSAEDAADWEGKLQYSLGAGFPPGAKIDPATGAFAWTPAETPGPGRYEVAVLVQGPDGQTAQTSLTITVTRPSLALEETAVELGGGVSLELVLIPAGEFLMGSPDSDVGAKQDEKPQHRVRITKPFYLSKYLTTQEQWQMVMGYGRGRAKAPKNPVEAVSWDECRDFLRRLNNRLGYRADTFVLPTEAQWEYACRAGSTTRYCFGDDGSQLGGYAWYNANSGNASRAVGEKRPNAWGIYDMHGNVWEWCADWYDSGYYANSPADDPTGPKAGLARVDRGGGWFGDAGRCRSADRDASAPGNHYQSVGFRVARLSAE